MMKDLIIGLSILFVPMFVGVGLTGVYLWKSRHEIKKVWEDLK